MRILLFIPVLILFLSNVPFVQKRPMEKMVAAMKADKGCCKKKQTRQVSCHKEEAPPAGKTAPTCCHTAAATCVCICCFQVMAPFSNLHHFHFTTATDAASYTGYIQPVYQNPSTAIPWQPPDIV